QDAALNRAKAAFYVKLTLKNGKTYTGVKVTAQLDDKLTLATDSGNTTCVTGEVEAADLQGLLATQTPEVLKANAARKAEIAARAAASEAYQQKKIANGNYLDDMKADIPTGGLPVEYVRFMQKLGDPWTRKPGQAK